MRNLNPDPSAIRRNLIEAEYKRTSKKKTLQNMSDEEVAEMEKLYGPLSPAAKARRAGCAHKR